MIINIFLTDDPVCPCCNEHMDKAGYWIHEEVGVTLTDDDFYCPCCAYVAFKGVNPMHVSEVEKKVKHFEATYIGNKYRSYASIRVIEAQ